MYAACQRSGVWHLSLCSVTDGRPFHSAASGYHLELKKLYDSLNWFSGIWKHQHMAEDSSRLKSQFPSWNIARGVTFIFILSFWLNTLFFMISTFREHTFLWNTKGENVKHFQATKRCPSHKTIIWLQNCADFHQHILTGNPSWNEHLSQ